MKASSTSRTGRFNASASTSPQAPDDEVLALVNLFFDAALPMPREPLVKRGRDASTTGWPRPRADR